MVRILAIALCAVFLVACASSGTTSGGDCTSHYEVITEASSQAEVRDAMVRGAVPGARSTRVQDREDEKTVIDVLDRKGRRLMQVDVFRRDDGSWMAGQWAQCTD